MGLDASVRRRCFEEGKLKPGPLPLDDLYIYEEGYLCSKTLDAAEEELGFNEFMNRYRDLYYRFEEWVDHEACEHEFGDYCTEWVSNWAGVAGFESRVEETGGETEFPPPVQAAPRSERRPLSR